MINADLPTEDNINLDESTDIVETLEYKQKQSVIMYSTSDRFTRLLLRYYCFIAVLTLIIYLMTIYSLSSLNLLKINEMRQKDFFLKLEPEYKKMITFEQINDNKNFGNITREDEL